MHAGGFVACFVLAGATDLKPSKWFRFFSLFIVGAMTISIAMLAVLEVSGRHQDKLARSVAEDATVSYRRQFQIGEPLASVESSLAALRANTLHRGNDILIIAKEGRPVWYCNHNYFGISLRFSEGKLHDVVSDEWIGACL